VTLGVNMSHTGLVHSTYPENTSLPASLPSFFLPSQHQSRTVPLPRVSIGNRKPLTHLAGPPDSSLSGSGQ
jgi:hypothetical protein